MTTVKCLALCYVRLSSNFVEFLAPCGVGLLSNFMLYFAVIKDVGEFLMVRRWKNLRVSNSGSLRIENETYCLSFFLTCFTRCYAV